jgi:hypothetical protein
VKRYRWHFGILGVGFLVLAVLRFLYGNGVLA